MTYAPRSRRALPGRVAFAAGTPYCRNLRRQPDHRARSAVDAGAAGDGGYSSGSGVYVMRIPHENDSEEEQLLSSDVGPFEILQARQLLESNIAAFAAKMATRADIDNLKRIIEQEQRAIALNDTAQDNARLFHLVLAGATQNQMLLATVERIWLQMDSSPLWQQFNVHIASRAWRLKWLGDRQTLLAALRRRDVMGAWQAMWQHLENVKNSLLELSDEDAPTLTAICSTRCRFFREAGMTILPLYAAPQCARR